MFGFHSDDLILTVKTMFCRYDIRVSLQSPGVKCCGVH